jgi:DNA polymerase-3 subunit chi
MSQVDFYVLPENNKRERFACTLIQKVWKQGNNIYINARSEAEAMAFDDLLWTFRDISFLPHCLTSDDNIENVPIIIGHDNQIDDQIPANTKIMINFADQIPQKLGKIERILEIVAGSESERRLARKRYADYRHQGHILNNHKIESEDG